MIVPRVLPVIVWGQVEGSSELEGVAHFLNLIPDAPLLDALRRHRGRGRNTYKVEWLWGVLLLTMALRHQAIEHCLTELRRNPTMRLLLGMESQQQVPKKWNMSRFLLHLGQEPFRGLLVEAFNTMVRRLGERFPMLGEHNSGDSTALSARRGESEQPNGDLPGPTGGRKEYHDANGKVTKILEWFGYKLHLLVDSRLELALAYAVSDTKTSDQQMLPALLDQAAANLPPGRMRTVAYDKAADTHETHQACLQRGLKPVVETRKLWTGPALRPLPGQAAFPVPLTHDEHGQVYCHDVPAKTGAPPSAAASVHRRDQRVRVTPGAPPGQDPHPQATVVRKMAHWGYEADRQTIKYRCPAQMFNFSCRSESKCNVGKAWGLSVRIKVSEDPRRFPAIPRETPLFRRLYKGRTSVERVNARLKLYWGPDDGNFSGALRFHAMVGAVMIVHLACATALAEGRPPGGSLGQVGVGNVNKVLRQSQDSS